MRGKKINQYFRFKPDVVSELNNEAERTGKTKTQALEDLVLFRRIFSEEAEAELQRIARKANVPIRKAAEMCILVATGKNQKLALPTLPSWSCAA